MIITINTTTQLEGDIRVLQYCDINLSFFFKQYMYFGNLNLNTVLLS